MMENQNYLMVVSPHPDDCEFGIAGTVAGLVKEGKQVVYVICTNGDKGTSDRSLKPRQLAEIRGKDHLADPELLDEGLEPHKVMELWFWGIEEPNYRVDITATMEIKLTALACHKSQVGDLSPEMKARIKDFATKRAKGENFELAEAFYRLEIRN